MQHSHGEDTTRSPKVFIRLLFLIVLWMVTVLQAVLNLRLKIFISQNTEHGLMFILNIICSTAFLFIANSYVDSYLPNSVRERGKSIVPPPQSYDDHEYPTESVLSVEYAPSNDQMFGERVRVLHQQIRLHTLLMIIFLCLLTIIEAYLFASSLHSPSDQFPLTAYIATTIVTLKPIVCFFVKEEIVYKVKEF